MNKPILFLLTIVIMSAVQFFSFSNKKKYLRSELSLQSLIDINYYSKISYCSKPNIEQWNCGPDCNKKPNMQNIKVLQNNTTSTQGYCAYNSQTNTIILAFRGTSDTTNWLHNIDFLRDEYKGCQGCKVHSGFYEAYKSIESQSNECVQELLKLNPSAELLVTGHSYGAALALISTASLGQLFQDKNRVSLYTFGCPRVGNLEFQQYFDTNYQNNFRIVNSKDLVPHVPSSLQSMFVHVGKEIWLNEKEGQVSFKICGQTEDQNCSYSVNPFLYSIDEHLNYFGMYTGCTSDQINLSEQGNQKQY